MQDYFRCLFATVTLSEELTAAKREAHTVFEMNQARRRGRPLWQTRQRRLRSLVFRRGQEMKKQILARGLEPGDMTPEEFGRHIRADIERWRTVVKAAGIQAR